MLDVFLIEIHGAVPVAKLGLIYGAMLFRTFFGTLLWASYGMLFLDVNWDDNWDDNYDANWDTKWDTNWDVDWDANYHPK